MDSTVGSHLGGGVAVKRIKHTRWARMPVEFDGIPVWVELFIIQSPGSGGVECSSEQQLVQIIGEERNAETSMTYEHLGMTLPPMS